MQAPAELSDRAAAAARFPLRHLAERFLFVLTSRGPGPEAQEEVAALLAEKERNLFFAQSPPDQEHAHQTMRRAAIDTDDRTVLRAALLHDVGKAGNRLGAMGRAVATLLDAVGLPLWAEARAYRRHGAIGARRLRDLGAEPLAVDFAARHPDPDPGPHDPTSWRLLLDADHGVDL